MFSIKMLAQVLAFVADKINSSEAYRRIVIELGAELRDLIPSDSVEPELAETIDLFKIGLLEGKDGIERKTEVKKKIKDVKS